MEILEKNKEFYEIHIFDKNGPLPQCDKSGSRFGDL